MSVWVAVVLGPVILAVLTSFLNGRAKRADAKIRRAEKLEDWARQDAVAEQAAEAATLLLAANERVAGNTEEQSRKLDDLRDGQQIIHTLVNSNVTREMEARLEGTRREIAGLKEIVELRKAAGQVPTKEALAAILVAEETVHSLEVDLADRRRQQEVVEAQQRE